MDNKYLKIVLKHLQEYILLLGGLLLIGIAVTKSWIVFLGTGLLIISYWTLRFVLSTINKALLMAKISKEADERKKQEELIKEINGKTQ